MCQPGSFLEVKLENKPLHRWPAPVSEGRIVLRWIIAYLSPLSVPLRVLLKVIASPAVTSMWLRLLHAKCTASFRMLHSHYELKCDHLISHSKFIFLANEN